MSDAGTSIEHARKAADRFAAAVRDAGAVLQNACHGAAVDAGWWTDLTTGDTLAGSGLLETPHIIGEKLMLIVSEVAEAMESHRKGLTDDKLPHRLGIEVELADAVIRIADLAGACRLDLGGAIAEKLAYNATREDHKPGHRRATGGKRY